MERLVVLGMLLGHCNPEPKVRPCRAGEREVASPVVLATGDGPDLRDDYPLAEFGCDSVEKCSRRRSKLAGDFDALLQHHTGKDELEFLRQHTEFGWELRGLDETADRIPSHVGPRQTSSGG